MKKFEVGKKYFTTSICDSNCKFIIEIVKRTDKTVTFRKDGKERRTKLFSDENGEYIIPERYSMAPVYRATGEYEEPVEVEPVEAPTSEPQIQPEAEPTTILAYTGQQVIGNWGAMYPTERGKILRFVEQPATRFSPAETLVEIKWEDGRKSLEALARIRPEGQRAAGGSPIGIYFAKRMVLS